MRETEILAVRPHRDNSENTRMHFVFFLTYFLQEFALDSQLPGGHLLRLLTLGFAGSVRVGNVDPELALLLCNFRGTSRCIRNSGNN